jgi:hypothetical protein
MPPFTLNFPQGSVTFPFSADAARELKAEIALLLDSLKSIAGRVSAGGKPVPRATMEYRHAGEVSIEVFCNPNIYSGPFAAKVLLTIRDERSRLVTEAELTRVIEDLDRYLAQDS